MKNYYALCRSVALLAALSLPLSALAQVDVSGTVRDNSNQETLAGVNVIVKGTTIGTVTDINGEYRLSVDEVPAELTFSFIGYLSQTVPISTSANVIDVALEEDMTSLEEVVVTGLASSVKRSNLANAISTISGEELTGVTEPQTVDNALYGKIPGVNITANDGAPGGGVSVQLRGISTLGAGSSQPLYIVDGVYVNNSSLRSGRTLVSGAASGENAASQDNSANRIADINPDDIESIEVLKGPSAAAIYGTRANAGVIIITTKKGEAGETRVNLRQDIGFASALNLQNFEGWNPEKIRLFYGEDASQAQLDLYNQALAQGTIVDWEEEMYGETPLLVSTQVSVSGGSEKTQFYVSGRLQSEDGIIKNTGFERYSIRANLDHAITKSVSLNVNANYLRTDTDRGFTGNQNNTGGSIGYTIASTPTYASLQPDAQGNYPNNPYFNDNPYAIRDLTINNSLVNRFITSFALDIDIFQTENSFLKFTGNGGVDYLSNTSLIHFPEILQHQQASPDPAGDVVWGNQNAFNTNLQGFFIFNTNLGNVNLNTQVGGVRLDQDAESLLNRGRGLSSGQTNLRWAAVQAILDQEVQVVTDVGWVAQQEINWEDKVIGTLGVRFDRSTLNGDQDKYYAFPKASLAVNVANFDFWNVSTINVLKARVAYGETGGLPLFGNTFESLTPQLIGTSLGAQVGTRAVAPDLVPETASEIEFGLDAALLDNRVSLEATYYVKTVNDLILDQEPAESTGILAIATNAGDLQNTGIELGLGASPVRTNNFAWSTNLLYWRNDTEMTRLDIPNYTTGGFGPALGTYLIAEGYSPTTIVGTPPNEDVPGGFSILGDRQPDFQASWSNQITFLKNFELSFLWHWSEGGDNINLSAFLWDSGGNTPGWSDDPDGDGVPFGRERGASLVDGASAYVQDASFIKLREVGLYYTFPGELINQWFDGWVERIKIGASGNNLLLFTDYESYDPEVSNFGVQAVTSSIEVTPYPTARRMMFHLSVGF